MAQESFYCEKCNRTMSADQFYGSNNLEKYPQGKLRQCKKCITMHVDNFNPDTTKIHRQKYHHKPSFQLV